jgi:hypothetical protein
VNLPGVNFHQLAGEPILSEVAAVFRANEQAPAVLNFIRQIRATPVRCIEPADW